YRKTLSRDHLDFCHGLLGLGRCGPRESAGKRKGGIMGADECYLEGAEAARNGRPLSDNPYEEGTEDYLSWQDGWNSVKNE
ncbi:MAG: hypothetical protein ACE5GX_19830, partial [Thermoanaerobaculia bacterium]